MITKNRGTSLKSTVIAVLLLFIIAATVGCQSNAGSKPGLDSDNKNRDTVESRLYPILVDNKVGFIDEIGKTVVTPKYSNSHEFNEGFCGVKLGDKWGFIDVQGKYIISPRFLEVGNFCEGMV
jgi:hypothetical protein